MANRNPIRTRSILTGEQQWRLVIDYLNGVRRVDLSQKYNLFPTQIYAYLRKHGVQANRRPSRGLPPCVVCGAARSMPPYSPGGMFRAYTPTCGDEACKSILVVRPDLHPYTTPKWYRRKGYKASKRERHNKIWDDAWEIELRREIVNLDDTELAALERAFVLGVDERGADISEEARRSLWGRLSEMSVAVHLRSTEPADTAITLSKRRPLQEFLRRYFGKDTESAADVADAFDVVYLWRCACPQQESYVVKSVADFPSDVGTYGICSTCSSAALVIE